MNGLEDWLPMTEVARQSGASMSQLRRWHGEGLIRGCRRRPVPGKQGPGVHQCPADAVEAARTLVRCRSHVPSIAEAKFWLWMEGYERIRIDPNQLTSAVREMVQGVRGLAESPGVLDDDGLDRQVTQPMIQAKESRIAAHAAAAFAAELLGRSGAWRLRAKALASLPEVEEGGKQTPMTGVDADVADDLFGSPMVRAVLQRAGVSVSKDVGIKAPITVTELCAVAGLGAIESEAVDWEGARLLWQLLCLAADMPARTQLEKTLRNAMQVMRQDMYTGRVELHVLLIPGVLRLLSLLMERLPPSGRGGVDAAAELRRLAQVLPDHEKVLTEEGIAHLLPFVKRAAEAATRGETTEKAAD